MSEATPANSPCRDVQLEAIAYCDKCGRKFVYVNPNCKTDVWPTKADPKTPCGGNVLPIAKEERHDKKPRPTG